MITRLSAASPWCQETVEMSDALNSQSEASNEPVAEGVVEAVEEPVAEPAAEAVASSAEEAMVLSHVTSLRLHNDAM